MSLVKFKEYVSEAMRVPVLDEDGDDVVVVEWSEEGWAKNTVAERAELEAEAVNGWAMWQVGAVDDDEDGEPDDATGIYEGDEIAEWLDSLEEQCDACGMDPCECDANVAEWNAGSRRCAGGDGRRKLVKADKGVMKSGLAEREMTKAELVKREEIVLELKKREKAFKEKYGDKWKDVMYATATKLAMKEDFDLEEGPKAYKAKNTMQRRKTQRTKDKQKFQNRGDKLRAKIDRKKGGNKVKRIKMRKKWMRKNKAKIKNAQRVYGGKVKSKFTKKK